MNRHIIFGVSTFLLMVGIACFAVYSSFSDFSDKNDKGDYKIVKTLESPDGNHTATLWDGMGGGAAGWCYQRVSIDTKENPFDLKREEEKGGYIFSTNCGSKISVNWENSNQLHISYTNQKFGVSAYQNPSSQDDKVKISYEIKN